MIGNFEEDILPWEAGDLLTKRAQQLQFKKQVVCFSNFVREETMLESRNPGPENTPQRFSALNAVWRSELGFDLNLYSQAIEKGTNSRV